MLIASSTRSSGDIMYLRQIVRFTFTKRLELLHKKTPDDRDLCIIATRGSNNTIEIDSESFGIVEEQPISHRLLSRSRFALLSTIRQTNKTRHLLFGINIGKYGTS